MSDNIDIRRIFGRLLQTANTALNKQLWFVILEDEGIDQNAIKLRTITGLESNSYMRMLMLSGLVRSDATGVKFIKKAWDQLMLDYVDSDGKERYTNIKLIKKCFVLRLGGTKQRGFKDAREQMLELTACPRIPQLNELRAQLHDKFCRISKVYSSSDSSLPNESDVDDDSIAESTAIEQHTNTPDEELPTNNTTPSDQDPPNISSAEPSASISTSLGIKLQDLSRKAAYVLNN